MWWKAKLVVDAIGVVVLGYLVLFTEVSILHKIVDAILAISLAISSGETYKNIKNKEK